MIRRSSFARLLHSWLTVSSLAVAVVLWKTRPNPSLVALKDLAIFAALAFCLPMARRGNRTRVTRFAPLAAILGASIILASESPVATLASLRQLLAPYVLIAIGYLAVRTLTGHSELMATIRRNLWILLLFGLFERFVGLWHVIHLANYFTAKNIALGPGGVPYEFIEPIGRGIPRMASLLLDPINTGHSLVCLLCIEMTVEREHRRRNVAAVLAGVVLTTSKGAIVQVALVFGWLNPRISKMVRAVTAAVAVLLVAVYGSLHGGIAVHVNGFLHAFDHLTLFGHGLASAGNQAALFSTAPVTQPGIGDSFFGAVIGQIGVVGLAVWLWPLLTMIRRFPKKDLLRRLLVAQLMVAVLSENSFNLLSVYSACLLLGAALSVRENASSTRLEAASPQPLAPRSPA